MEMTIIKITTGLAVGLRLADLGDFFSVVRDVLRIIYSNLVNMHFRPWKYEVTFDSAT